MCRPTGNADAVRVASARTIHLLHVAVASDNSFIFIIPTLWRDLLFMEPLSRHFVRHPIWLDA